jgi:hypothetical protein
MKLADDEREVLMAEVAQALEQVRTPEMRARYGDLLTAVDQGEVPEDLLDPLQVLLEVGLESGRIRKVHTAHGEMAAGRVYGRTPRGRAVRATAEAVNEALQALQGQTIEEISVSPHGPGSYSLSIGTDQGKVLLRISRHGVRLQTLEVG